MYGDVRRRGLTVEAAGHERRQGIVFADPGNTWDGCRCMPSYFCRQLLVFVIKIIVSYVYVGLHLLAVRAIVHYNHCRLLLLAVTIIVR